LIVRDLKRAGIMVAHFAAEGRPVRGHVAAGLRAPHNPLPPGGRNTQQEGQSRHAKIFLFISISDYHIEGHPNPAEGRIAIVTNAGWECGGRRRRRREGLCRAGNRERRRRAHDRCSLRTAKSCGPGARGLCAKCCGDVAARPGPQHQPSARRRGQ